MITTLQFPAALVLAQRGVFMPTEASAADEPLPIFIGVDGNNMSEWLTRLEGLSKELKGER